MTPDEMIAEPRPIFGIFEGGGAKGIAHVGAIAAAEATGLQFAGVAGASAGAIVAALLAGGYKADDIFSSARNNIFFSCTQNIRDALRQVDDIEAAGKTHSDALKEICLSAATYSRWRQTFGSPDFARRVTPISEFFGEQSWRNFFALRRLARWLWLPMAFIVSPRSTCAVWTIFRHLGHFPTARIAQFINDALICNLCRIYIANGEAGRKAVPDQIQFKHLRYEDYPNHLLPLKIVVTNLSTGYAELFDHTTHPEALVGEVVAASAAIPIIFRSVQLADSPGVIFVDGGLVSNLPFWVFREEKLAYERAYKGGTARIPIVAFTLETQNDTTKTRNLVRTVVCMIAASIVAMLAIRLTGLWTIGAVAAIVAYPVAVYIAGRGARLSRFLQNIARSSIFGSQDVARKLIDDLMIVDIPCLLSTLDFDTSGDGWEKAYGAAKTFVRERLLWEFDSKPRELFSTLQSISEDAHTLINKNRAQRSTPPLAALRACIVIPSPSKQSMRVAYGYNMSDDADDKLPLDRRQPGAPIAFKDKELMCVPLGAHQPGPHYMTKYERALLPSTLRSAICVPIFDNLTTWEVAAPLRPAPLGVFCLDSSDDLSEDINDNELQDLLKKRTIPLALSLAAHRMHTLNN